MRPFKRILKDIKDRRTPKKDPIEHVVVLMFENHSFDQMLGCFKSIYPDLEGIDLQNLRSNKDSTGREYVQRESNNSVVSPDPKHELDHILNQIKDGNLAFVSEYEREYPETTPEQRQRIMDYFGLGDLPALHELARHFAICDHWYSSVPGPTWTNRFFVHSGTSNGLVTMPEAIRDREYYGHYTQDTIYDRLNEKRISWRVYFGDIPQSLVLRHQRLPRNASRYRLMHGFYRDVQDNALPAYSFIEPNYFKGAQNDDHPPHSTVRAQDLLANVYNALRENLEVWNKTLLVVLYDEHGGFYDHVKPPSAVPPGPNLRTSEYTFDRLGVRVPALLISPWVDPGVLSTELDHTSLLKYLTEKWELEPLTERVRRANSFKDAIRTTGDPRDHTPVSLPVSMFAMEAMGEGLPEGVAPGTTMEELAEPTNDYQQSLMLFAEHLAEEELPVEARLPELMMAGPLGEEQQAKMRVMEFLTMQNVKAAAAPDD